MVSRFAKDVDRECPLAEYPRPQMVRKDWICLNGSWDCAVTASDAAPAEWDSVITVPYPPESELSGVRRITRQGERLWYRRSMSCSPEEGKRTLIHFGAVDQTAVLYVNGTEAGSHVGGYTAFTFDITDLLREGENELMLRVTDDFDAHGFARGKQSMSPGGIWYTPVSGIWQTVWTETVPEEYVSGLKILPDTDSSACYITVCSSADEEVYIECCGKVTAGRTNRPVRLDMQDFRFWSPEDPFLYDFTVRMGTDEVTGYFGMRKFSVEKAADGSMRLFLNGKPYFHNGLLDQGYWPDGIYVPPTDEAMVYDIKTMKEMGFNCLRKHIKIEPARWYYHCDRLGMLVWQDMPSGGGKYSPVVQFLPVLFSRFSIKDDRYKLFARADAYGRLQYYKDLEEMIRQLYNCTCIAVWVPFNEGWGQFDSAKAVELIESLDRSRTIDHASGWHDQHTGQVQSLHIYFKPVKFRKDRYGRAVCLTEFGGLTLGLEGHTFGAKESGYIRSADMPKLAEDFEKLYREQIFPAMEQGLAAAIYTQVSDVEGEVNGLLTYDREVEKIAPERCRSLFGPVRAFNRGE